MSAAGSRVVGILVVAWLALVGCGAPGGPQTVSLADLVAAPDDFDGQEVVVEGVVRAFDEPFHIWIEDPVPNRVELEPLDVAADLVGLTVEVRGRFTFADDRGRVIEVQDIEVVDGTPQA